MAVAGTDFAVGVRNASKLFLDGAVIAFRQLTLDVRNQEILCIVGPSGCGKTTFLRCIAGLIDLSSGDLAVFGKKVVGPPPGVAMVFQHFGLLPWKTVYQNAAFGLAMAGAPAPVIKERVRHYLDLVGLTGFEQQYPYQLSGGMQQRVGLARAFATDADILLMDEPFSALDPLIRRKLQDELLALQERVKKTILFVSHDLDEALKLGDKITILEGGRIVQTGTAQDIVHRPANEYVAEFVRHINPRTAIKGAPPVVQA
jgi:ABC-type proline/glycine betaine transport system ATPase subunit